MKKFNKDFISKIDNNIEKEKKEFQSKMNSSKETAYLTRISKLNQTIQDEKYNIDINIQRIVGDYVCIDDGTIDIDNPKQVIEMNKE